MLRKICSQCGAVFNPSSDNWQEYPFEAHYCWEYGQKDVWYHRRNDEPCGIAIFTRSKKSLKGALK